MKTARFFALLALIGLVLANPFSLALAQGQLQGVTVNLGDPRPSQPTYHNFTFSLATGATLRAFEFNWCKESNPIAGCTQPDGFTALTARYNDSTTTGLTARENWAINNVSVNSALVSYATGEPHTSGTVMSFRLDNITNSLIAANCDGDSDVSSDTCYVHLATCTTVDCSGANLDEGIGTYTVVNTVTISARVDPTFTFVLAGTGATTTYNGITTSVATTASTVPFANMTANTPKYAAQSLTVTTNTQSGYTVSVRALQPSVGEGLMQGVYTANHIDPFVAAWGAPTTWTSPTGTAPNVNTAWLGANTTDTDVSGWAAGTGLFGGISNSSNVVVMQKNSSDNGANPVYVTYAMEANVFQPADTYTGTLVYTAVPTY